MKIDSIERIPFEDLKEDYVLEIEEVITPRRMRRFATTSHDWGWVHVDPYFASQTQFKRRIVHGALFTSYLSAIINRLLGPGTIVINFAVKFKPIPLGELVVLRTEFIKIRRRTRTIALACSCSLARDRGISSAGTADILVMPDIDYEPRRHQRLLTWVKDMVLQP